VSFRDDSLPPPPSPKLRYPRVVLKLSGEALCGVEGGFGIQPETLKTFAGELAEVHAEGVQIGIVVGGGNIFRGLKGASAGMDRAQSDYMGMLGTVINALALQDALEKREVPSRVMTALEVHQVAEPYIRRRAIRHLEKGRLVIFKATKVDGIYDRDPARHDDAKMFTRLTYDRFLADRIGVMDSTAVTLCRDNKMPIRVFKLTERGNIRRVCMGEDLGTVVDF